MFEIYEIFSKILDWAFVFKTMMIFGSKNSRLSMHFLRTFKHVISPCLQGWVLIYTMSYLRKEVAKVLKLLEEAHVQL